MRITIEVDVDKLKERAAEVKADAKAFGSKRAVGFEAGGWEGLIFIAACVGFGFVIQAIHWGFL